MPASMYRPAPWWLLAGLGASVACTPGLSEIESRQRDLRREVDELSSDVAEMRSEMQQMGILPEGPVSADLVAPDTPVDLSVEVTVEGEPPTLPALGRLERREGTPCGYRIRAVPLSEISDRHLVEAGSGAVSPVTVTYGGRPLTPHAGPARFENDCGGAFRLMPRFLFLAPFVEGDVDGEWTIGVAREQPVRRDDGLGLYWVYPGTTITFAFDEAWDPQRGAFGVHLDGRLLHVGRAPTEKATVDLLGRSIEVSGDRIAAPEPPAPPDGPWTLTIRSPPSGPWVLVEALWIGNRSVGQVVVPAPEAS